MAVSDREPLQTAVSGQHSLFLEGGCSLPACSAKSLSQAQARHVGRSTIGGKKKKINQLTRSATSPAGEQPTRALR